MRISNSSSNAAATPLDALRAAIGKFAEPASIAPMRAKLAEVEARLTTIERAIEANRAAITADSQRDRIDAYLEGGTDPRAERDRLSAELGLARDAARALRDRIQLAHANACAEWAASRNVTAPVAAMRERTAAAAVALWEKLGEAQEMVDTGERVNVTLAGSAWPGNAPFARNAVAMLLVDLSECGAPVHPHVVREARALIGR